MNREIVFISHFHNMSIERKSYVTFLFFGRSLNSIFLLRKVNFLILTAGNELHAQYSQQKKSVFSIKQVCLRLRRDSRALSHSHFRIFREQHRNFLFVVRNNVGQRSKETNIAASHEKKKENDIVQQRRQVFARSCTVRTFQVKPNKGSNFIFNFCSRKRKAINVNVKINSSLNCKRIPNEDGFRKNNYGKGIKMIFNKPFSVARSIQQEVEE